MDFADTREETSVKNVLGLLLFRKEVNCMCKENAYVLCWTRLEETLFKEETKNIQEMLFCRKLSALFLCLPQSLSSGIKTPRFQEWFFIEKAEATTTAIHKLEFSLKTCKFKIYSLF